LDDELLHYGADPRLSFVPFTVDVTHKAWIYVKMCWISFAIGVDAAQAILEKLQARYDGEAGNDEEAEHFSVEKGRVPRCDRDSLVARRGI